MIISEFWLGVLVTITVEFIVIIGLAIQQILKEKGKEGE